MTNYKDLIFNRLSELKKDKDSNVFKLKALELLIELLNIRYEKDRKAFVDKPENIIDKYNAKRNLEIVNHYIEDFFFINRIENTENFSIRKECRRILHVLHDECNN